MPKYNVLAEVSILDTNRLPGEIVEISAEDASLLVETGKIVLIEENGAGAEPAPLATPSEVPPAEINGSNGGEVPPAPAATPEEPPVNTPPAFGAPPAPVHQPQAPAEKPWVGGHTI